MELKKAEVMLQKVSRKNLPKVRAMTEEVWWHHFPGILSEKQIAYMLSRLYSVEAMEAELECGKVSYRFILCEGVRAGFCAFGPTENPGEMKIHKLYVLPRFQRRGCGSGALQRIEELWRNMKGTTLILAVNKQNRGAIYAYRQAGFAIQESVCVDIGEGFFMDDYIMVKRLA